jgi:DNA-binding transcriptional ArsR family regulator
MKFKNTFMGLSKTSEFTVQQVRIAELAKALAHPARVAIVQHLLLAKECICGELVEVLPLSQSTVSQHLKEMKKAGLILGSVEPPRVCYCINPAALQELRLVLGSFANKCC